MYVIFVIMVQDSLKIFLSRILSRWGISLCKLQSVAEEVRKFVMIPILYTN